MQYRVDYDNVAVQQKEREVEKKKVRKGKVKEKYEEEKKNSRSMLLNVPVKASMTVMQLFLIIFHTGTGCEDKGVQSETNPLAEQSEAPMEQKQQVENWLKDFFKKYAMEQQMTLLT
ncbi:hypothetical protein I6G80_00490 (plasmid) [Bacillus licheniformis]|uniref:Uncharacterized protein n=1 Tax=Bacillus licheniformis TaxID=1402 RepID=A0AB37GMB1_BACLI|nr:hypothetical protein [Bacillus licheniformis]QPR70601.1 hypothetical protein I6G80_00490 [Bacillus licheniformis]